MVSFLMLGIWSACKQPDDLSADQPPPNDKVLRYDVNAPFTTFNPYSNDAFGSTHVFPLLYSYLFVPDAENQFQADLATRWRYDPDKRCWTIVLRTDARFHNRQPVTAKDVQYSLTKLLLEYNPALNASIDRIDLLSIHQLCIYLKKEDPTFLNKIWSYEIVPCPDSGIIDFINHPVGSGPFYFSQKKGRNMVVLKANADYYDGRPALNRIEFNFQPDREKAWARLLSGDTDIAQEISPLNYEIIKQYQDRFYFDHFTMPHYTIMLYNTYDPLFVSPKVRQALTMSIDREYIVDHILKGYGQVAIGPMGVGSPYSSPDLKPWPYNPQRAMTLLKQNGWAPNEKGRLQKNGRPFEFTLFVYKESQTDKEVARFIQLSLNNLGIQMHLKALGFEELTKKYKSSFTFQAVLTEIVGAYRKPEVLINFWSTSSHGQSEAGHFSHPKVTQRLLEAFSEKSPIRQRALLQQCDSLIADLQPGTFLFHKTAIDAMSKRFHLPYRFSMTHEGIYRLKSATLVSE